MEKYRYKSNNNGNQKKRDLFIEKDFFNPYCFSTISERVYKPHWRNMISHDIPFSDGVSGSIDLTFEALTPIIVKEGKDNPLSVNMNGRYFIPATSIKGMIRNVLEILTLSKIGPVTKDNRYSMRDLTPNNKDYTLKGKLGEIKAGLLVKVNDEYKLIQCDYYESMTYAEIEETMEIPKEKSGNLKYAPDVKSKYDLIDGIPFFEEGKDSFVMFFTGKMNSKEHEYAIRIPQNISCKPLAEGLIKDFLFIHEKETESKSWIFWKKKMNNFSRIPTYKELSSGLCFAPVFYTNNDDGNVDSLGLAFLHRERYKYSIHHFLNEKHKSDELDMAQCIFGSSEHDLKGRVQFSHAFVEMNGKGVAPDSSRIILGSPKPTFYPFYLKQDKNSQFASTFSDDEGEINGWKRYLVHDKFMPREFEKWTPKVGIEINPLPAEVTFTAKIRFHNLKPVELGALLSALTFHDNQDECFHLIGMGKPLGYGKLKLNNEIKLTIPNCDKLPRYYMSLFEKEISTEDGKNEFKQWKEEVTTLFRIASGKFDKRISYPGQGKEKPFDDFKAIKSKNLSISDFSPSLNEFELMSLQS